MDNHPPRFWLWCFRRFCKPAFLEDIEGDLIERFYIKAEDQGVSMAKRYFIKEILLLFRPGIVRSPFSVQQLNATIMFRTNMKIALRNIWRYQRTFLINLLGLSTGLACTLFIYLWVQHEYSIDQGFEKGDRLYQVVIHAVGHDGIGSSTANPSVLGPALRDEVSGIEDAAMSTRVWSGTLIKSPSGQHLAGGKFSEPNYFDMFDFPFLEGTANQVLADPNNLVVTQSYAQRMFPDDKSFVGKEVEMKLDGKWIPLVISGVIKDFDDTYSRPFDFVAHFDHFLNLQGEMATDWGNTSPSAFFLLAEGASFDEVDAQLRGLYERKTDYDKQWFSAVSYPNFYLHRKFENGVQSGGRITYVRLFSFIAFFILGIACINFMNLATAQASRRLKEIGVKKTMGALRHSLVVQQLLEATLIVLFSLILALGLVAILLPVFNQIVDKELVLNWDFRLLGIAIGIVLTAGLMAGSYPAFYLSSFVPAQVLKGTLGKVSGNTNLRRGLVVFQLVLSCLMLLVVGVVKEQVRYTQEMNLGYSQDQLLRISFENSDQAWSQRFQEQVNQVPGVLSSGFTSHNMMSHNSATTGVSWEGKGPEDRVSFELNWVGLGLIEAMGFKILDGRAFSEEYRTDTANFVINAKAAELMGYDDPVGSTFTWWDGTQREIIGVIDNYHYETVHEPYKPAIFLLQPDYTEYLMVRIEPAQTESILVAIEEIYGQVDDLIPFTYTFLDEAFEKQYRKEQQLGELSGYFAILAIVISVLGLVGLVAFAADRRRKEIGVRKVLGCSVQRILMIISKEFTVMVLLALVIALPVGYLIADTWLASFAFRTQVPWHYFVAVGVGAPLLTWAIVGLQAWRTAKLNPAITLKDE